ncbi:MAG: hypothetical protein ACW9W4_06370 [Candidatus Nitrosopumilus sp. bin_7KS]
MDEDIMSKEKFDKLTTVEDYTKLRGKIDEKINKIDAEVFQDLSKVDNFADFMKLFVKTQQLRKLEGAQITTQDMINFLTFREIEHRDKKLLEVLIKNAREGEKDDKENLAKLKELEEELNKVSKSRSLFGNISLSLFKNDMTGVGLD